MSNTVGHEATVVAREAGSGEALWFFGELATILVAGEQTAERFAIVEHRSPQGMSPPWHVQPDDDETFHVIDGEISFWASDPSKPLCVARPGSVVCVPRGIPHSFRIESDQAHFLTFHTPAGHERFYRAAGDTAPERPPEQAVWASGSAGLWQGRVVDRLSHHRFLPKWRHHAGRSLDTAADLAALFVREVPTSRG